MGKLDLERTKIAAGVYTGTLTSSAPLKGLPVLTLHLLDRQLGDPVVMRVAGRKNTWTVTAPVPAEAINEGLQTFIIRDAGSGATLDSFAMITGTPLEDDLRAELAFLRAEMELLKTAFRHHFAKKMT